MLEWMRGLPARAKETQWNNDPPRLRQSCTSGPRQRIHAGRRWQRGTQLTPGTGPQAAQDRLRPQDRAAHCVAEPRQGSYKRLLAAQASPEPAPNLL